MQQNYSIYLKDDCFQFITKDHDLVKRKIVTAANLHKHTGIILVGARHWSPAMIKQLEAMQIDDKDFEQGFIDQFDQFISRVDAKRIAIKNEQPLIGENWDVLFSENLH